MDMFGLDESRLKNGPVLDCPAGAASFAAEAHRFGINITACDILYDLTREELSDKGEADIALIYEKVAGASHLYRWEYYKDRDGLIAVRRKALETFLADFPDGLKQGRYVRAELPRLPFPDGMFETVISSHFLFLYGDRLDPDFHKACIMELVRVCSGEVVIFPLNGLDARPYPYVDDVLSFLTRRGIRTETVETSFEFQRGANKLLRLRKEAI
jgi:hypothetical protein